MDEIRKFEEQNFRAVRGKYPYDLVTVKENFLKCETQNPKNIY